MKKIKQLSFFFALAFSFLGMDANAQVTYQPAPNWGATEVSATVGNLYKPMFYNFGTPHVCRVFINPAPFGIPNYGDYSVLASETTLSGTGIHHISLDLPQSANLGWRAWYVILNSNYQVVSEGLLFNQVQPLNPLQISFPDPAYGYDGSLASRSISYNPDINSIFNPSDGESYTNIINVRLRCLTCPSGYDVTVSEAFASFSYAQGFIAHFNLPFDLSGDWCFEAWVDVDHNSITPEYWTWLKRQWGPGEICGFQWGYFTTGIEDREKESFNAFPNPFTDVITIDSPSVTEYSLLNISGQVVASGMLSVGENRLTDLSGIEPGAYIMQTDLESTRIIKQ